MRFNRHNFSYLLEYSEPQNSAAEVSLPQFRDGKRSNFCVHYFH